MLVPVAPLRIDLEFFDPSSSSTASLISCSDQRCALGTQSSDSVCSDQNQCGYTFQYGDGSGTSGVYMYDSIFFQSIAGNSMTSNTSSAPVVFGCSTSQSGDLTKPDRAVDGIFGFGQQGLSVISQLSSLGITPNAFSHCLKGQDGGGGILVLGQIVEPNLVYTPLVSSQPHYNITQSVSQSVRPLLSQGNQCYLTTSSVSDIFPPVSLNFAGGASILLRPQDYLLQQNSVGAVLQSGALAFRKFRVRALQFWETDIVLKDKIVVYDLAGQRIGWANYDSETKKYF
ncbi:hypothetical protein CASFOL_008463 [Castilleja foliolosa]|uniref:Xylanase inhibitor N-terminal domain-containing protein n=1 Tax=Castilleja foliolosa TaxID=1961234 RepID=A0ABD3DZ17_9LAMI